MVLQYNTNMLSHVPKHKAVRCLMEKNLLDEFCSGINNGAVYCELDINELRIYIKQSAF